MDRFRRDAATILAIVILCLSFQQANAQDLSGQQAAPFPVALSCEGGHLEAGGIEVYSWYEEPQYASCEYDHAAAAGITSFIIYPSIGGLPDLGNSSRYYRYSIAGFDFESPAAGTLDVTAEFDAGTYYCLEVAEGPGFVRCSLGTERSLSLTVPISGAHGVRIYARPIPIIAPSFAGLNQIQYSFSPASN